uniref:Uncharacterized protein n=1 Tax=Leptobrachium leishanense TaxID=445787 RepID=A0A8C5PN54_9ANUR
MGRGKRPQLVESRPGTPRRSAAGRLDSYFGPQPPTTQGGDDSSDMASSASSPEYSLPDLGAATQRIERLLADMPTRADIQSLVAEVREKLQQDIAEVRGEVSIMDTRLTRLEQVANTPHEAAITGSLQHSEVWRRIDDLDNRSRRQNLRIRGVPEEVSDAHIYLPGLFNHLLGSERVTAADLPRAHRALRPPPTSSTMPPRDLICFFADFSLKEAIYLKARACRTWSYDGGTIEIFYDISPTTLQARRALRPVTQALSEAQIPYRWGYPFSLSARVDNVAHLLRTPSDVPRFTAALGLPDVRVPDWEMFSLPGQGREMAPRPRRSRSRRRHLVAPVPQEDGAL